MRQSGDKTTAIDKALLILNRFAPYNQELGTSEISQQLGLHKATVSRILITLARHGYLYQNPQTKKYVLGPAVTDLTRAVNQSLKNNLVQIAQPFIDDLRDSLKETVILEVLSGEHTFMAYIAEGPQLVRLAGNIGDRVPNHAAAGSKAIFAFSPPEIRRRLYNGDLERYTDNTITDPLKLHQQFKEIRIMGVSFDQEEIDEGTNAIGAPVFNHEGVPVASVVVAGPPQRINLEGQADMVSALRETAAMISARLHYKREMDKAACSAG